jgi:DnaJ family protein C protein 9
MEEPPEEAFQATAARAKKRKQSNKVVEEDKGEDIDLGEEDIGNSEEDEEEEAPRKSKAREKVRGRGRVSSIA